MSTPAIVTLEDVQAAIAGQLDHHLGPVIPGLQVDPKAVASPTPPCLDVYPGDPFLERASFGGFTAGYVIRARVTTADHQDGQGLLLQMIDPRGPLSVWVALDADATLGGTVDDSTVESVSGFRFYDSVSNVAGGYSGALLGAELLLRVVL